MIDGIIILLVICVAVLIVCVWDCFAKQQTLIEDNKVLQTNIERLKHDLHSGTQIVVPKYRDSICGKQIVSFMTEHKYSHTDILHALLDYLNLSIEKTPPEKIMIIKKTKKK